MFAKIRFLLLVTIAFACSTALLPGSGATHSAWADTGTPDPNSPFGVAGVMRWPDWGTFDRPAQAMLDTGGAWVREDFAWGLIEPQEGRSDWTATDRIVNAVAQKHLNMLGIISYAANWATPSQSDDKASSSVSFYPPDNSRYYWFVRSLVSRYKNNVHYWEVWNEPNSDMFWKPRPNAAEYAALLKTAYKAVKDADPTAKVLNGGTAGNAVPFLEEMVAAGAGDSFDILAIHPYAVPVDPQQGRLQSRPDVHKVVEVELQKYRAFLQRHGYDRPIWATEIGWPAADWTLDAQAQANYMVQAYAQMLASGLVERVFWYSFKDDAAAPDKSWGLTGWGSGKTDLAPRRPAFAAYAAMTHTLAGAAPRGAVHLGRISPISSFETGDTWIRSTSAFGSFVTTGEQHHQGGQSAKLQYSFSAPNQAVDFAPPSAISLPGKPAELGVWVRGDGSGNYLSAWIKDRDGEMFKLMLGSVLGERSGWQLYSGHVNSYYFDWERAGGSPANHVVDYPVSLVAFRLENTPDEPARAGSIYLDDIQSVDGAVDGASVWAERFAKAGGQSVDVLWAAADGTVQLPTQSVTGQIIDRDGAARPINSNGGAFTVQVGARPVYVIHTPPDDTVQALNLSMVGSQQGASPCAAMQKAQPLNGADNKFIAETGHNLHGAFRAYWEAHGGIRLLGYPITEEFTARSSDGKPYLQQYFQRARMEYHPENAPPNDVQLGLLGVGAAAGRNFARVTATNDASVLFFPPVGHGIKLFRDWWQKNGAISVFGLPLSEELSEKSAADQKTYTVQYFERNRLEYHPEYRGTENEVLLGLLGAEYLAKQGCR